MIWSGLVALAVGVWAILRRGGDGPDLGTMSGQWLAEHLTHGRDERAVSVWAILRRGGDGPDLGTMSDQWLAEHRAHEHESDKR